MLEKIALQRNLITQAQCEDALAACRGAENLERALKDYFITENLIPLKQMKQLIFTFQALKIMKKNTLFGRIAVKLGFVEDAVFREDMTRQKQAVENKTRPRFIGEIWIENQTITQEQLRKMIQLSKQHSRSQAKKAPESNAQTETMPIAPQEPSTPPPQVPGARDNIPDLSLKKELSCGIILEIDKEGMTALVTKTDNFDESLTGDDLRAYLLEHDVFYGIVSEEHLHGFIRSKGFRNKPFKVASGEVPKPGKDARIEYYFDTDHLKAGDLDDEGNIDFKNRGEVPWVEEGYLLAEKFPMSEARNGRNIFDHVVEVAPAIDIPLKFKSGVIQSEDELKLYAETGGHPRLSWSGNIEVTDTFTVKEDVDYKTGHIDYSGDVEVKGTLKAGFRVRGHSIRINTLDGGEVHAQGDVTILNGVNDGQIYARGNVHAKFIQNSKIFCLGNLTVDKEILDCTIETSGAVIITTGEVMSSQITCNMGLYTRHLGTDKSTPNTVTTGVDTFTTKEIQVLQKKINRLKEALINTREKAASLSTEINERHHTTSRLAHEMDRVREDGVALSEELRAQEKGASQADSLESQIRKNNAHFSRLDKDLNEVFDRIEKNENQILDMEVELEMMEETLEDLIYELASFSEWQEANPGVPEITVTGRVSPGTIVNGPGSSREITESLSNVKIKEALSPVQDGSRPEIQVHDNIKQR